MVLNIWATYTCEDLPTKDGRSVGNLGSISPRAVDKIYEALQKGVRGRRIRQANISIMVSHAPGMSCAISQDGACGQPLPWRSQDRGQQNEGGGNESRSVRPSLDYATSVSRISARQR